MKKYIKDGKLVLPEGFNSDLVCSDNNLIELILPEGFNSDLDCDKKVKVYKWNELLTLERDRKMRIMFSLYKGKII